MAYTAKEIAEIFLAKDPDEIVGLFYLDRGDIVEKLEGLEDSQGNEVDVEKLVNNSFIKDVLESFDNDDYLWESFNNSLADAVNDVASERLREMESDKELWDTETEKTK